MKLRHLILLALFAAATFGGTFTCESHDDNTTVHVNTP